MYLLADVSRACFWSYLHGISFSALVDEGRPSISTKAVMAYRIVLYPSSLLDACVSAPRVSGLAIHGLIGVAILKLRPLLAQVRIVVCMYIQY